MRILFGSMLLIIGLFSGSIWADEQQLAQGVRSFLLKEIYAKYHNHPSKDLNIKITPTFPPNVDKQACNGELIYYFPIHSTLSHHSTVVAECRSNFSKWKMYIPVAVKVVAAVLSTARPLAAQHILSDSDLIVKKVNLMQLQNDYYEDPKQIVGLSLNSTVKQDTVLTPNLLGEGQYDLKKSSRQSS